jgi:hypothetical protein
MPSVNVEAEIAALVAELPGVRVADVPPGHVLIAGSRVPFPRAALVGDAVTFAHRLRLGRLLRSAALEAAANLMMVGRGPGTLRRTGYRRYVWVLGGTCTAAQWEAVRSRVETLVGGLSGPVREQIRKLLDGREGDHHAAP